MAGVSAMKWRRLIWRNIEMAAVGEIRESDICESVKMASEKRS